MVTGPRFPNGGIRKSDLEHGRYYFGRSRCTQIARWDGVKQVFVHWRQKFDTTFLEEIRCREDEAHFDVFDAFAPIGDGYTHSLRPIPVTELPTKEPSSGGR